MTGQQNKFGPPPELVRRRFSSVDDLIARIEVRKAWTKARNDKAQERREEAARRQREAEEKRSAAEVRGHFRRAREMVKGFDDMDRDEAIVALYKLGTDDGFTAEVLATMYDIHPTYAYDLANPERHREKLNDHKVKRTERAMTVACPKCGAQVGEPCVAIRTRKPILSPHDERLALAPRGKVGRPTVA